jgi:hypothetical protein
MDIYIENNGEFWVRWRAFYQQGLAAIARDLQ